MGGSGDAGGVRRPRLPLHGESFLSREGFEAAPRRPVALRLARLPTHSDPRPRPGRRPGRRRSRGGGGCPRTILGDARPSVRVAPEAGGRKPQGVAQLAPYLSKGLSWSVLWARTEV